MKLFLGLMTFSIIYSYGKAQSCTTNNITDNLASLLQTAFQNRAGQGTTATVTILQHQVVCLTTKATRGTYSSASVIVAFNCTGNACPGSDNLQQFEFTCTPSSSNMWSPRPDFAVPSSGSLTTPLRTDCGLCVETTVLMERFDNATHCVACSSLCNVGLMECTGIMDTDCCNGVVNNTCVDNCTAPARPLDSANYECTVFCDPLSNPDNGTIMLSSGNLVGSVATYVCDANFAVQGGVNRTCELNVDTTAWSASAPSCQFVMTTDSTTDNPLPTTNPAPPPTCEALEAGANQVISYTDGCSTEINCKALYSCADNYELRNGASLRTCSLPSDMIPVWSGVAPICEQQSGDLTQAEIAGIGIGVGVLVAAVIIVVVVIVIIALSRSRA